MSGFVDSPRDGRFKKTWTWECAQCGLLFQRVPLSRNDPKYCSNACYQAWAAKPGGSLLSKGHNKTPRFPVGTERVYHRAREKHARAFVKIAHPNVWRERAKVVWEASFGKIPKGSVVHHKDRNPLNDELSNLQVMTRSEHAIEHRDDMASSRGISGRLL